MSIAQIQKLGLTDLAQQLAIHPFDLVRILAVTGHLRPGLRFERSDVEVIRAAGGLETWWSPDALSPADPQPRTTLVKGICARLLEKGVVGEHATRLDNLLRGLQPAQQLQLRASVQAMVQEGLLRTRSTPAGLVVSVVPDRREQVERMSRGEDFPPAVGATLAN